MWSLPPQRRSNTYCLFFFAAWQLLSLASFAQRENIDSLKKVLPALKDTARIDCLNELSVQYILAEVRMGHFCTPCRDTLLYYNNLVYNESQKLHYLHGIAVSFQPKAALQNHFLGNFKEGEKLARESLKWYALTGNKKGIEISYFQVGLTTFFQHKHDEAEQNLDQSYWWAENNGNKEWMYNVLGFKYENYRDVGEYDKAFDAFEKTQQLNLAFNGKIDTFYEFYVLAELQRRLGNYSTALDYYKKVITLIDLPHENIWFRVSYPELFALNNQFDSAQYYFNQIDSAKCTSSELRFYLVSLGEFYLLKKEYGKSLHLLLRGLEYHREAKDQTQANRALLDVAQCYAALQKDGDALGYVYEGLDIAHRSRSKQYLRDAYKILFEIYQRNGKLDSAFSYHQNYVTQKEIVANDVVKGQFAAYNYNQRISSLDKEKSAQHQQLKQAAQQRSILAIGIAGLLLLGVFLIRNILLKRKNEKNLRQLAENELQLQKFESERTKSEFQQKTTALEMQALRAQMNPHFIFNSLNSINRFILQNNKLQASEYLTKFSRLVRLILQNSQTTLTSLESELEALQLYLELEALRFDHHFDYKINVEEDLDVSTLKLPPLLIQPYVENAIWHGLMHKEEKGHLHIGISQNDDMLLCKIADDGIGRKRAAERRSKSAATHKSMGMQITANRIAMLHQEKHDSFISINDLVLPDGNAGGTEVILKIPVTQ
jgi:hypothetical protein